MKEPYETNRLRNTPPEQRTTGGMRIVVMYAESMQIIRAKSCNRVGEDTLDNAATVTDRYLKPRPMKCALLQ